MKSTATNNQKKLFHYAIACPYSCDHICHASFSLMHIDMKQRENCCNTDNYDNCPIFLSKILRMGKSSRVEDFPIPSVFKSFMCYIEAD